MIVVAAKKLCMRKQLSYSTFLYWRHACGSSPRSHTPPRQSSSKQCSLRCRKRSGWEPSTSTVWTLGHRTLYFNCGKLFQTLKQKRGEGNHQRFVARIARTPLLILDDFGLVPLDAQDRLSLLEIIEDRYGCAATVIASQVPVSQWFNVIGDPTIADAVCDRIVPQAIRISLSGMSMRALKGLQEQSDPCTIPAG